jgi:nucleotide-binding universal stress UspA family protein
MKVLIGYDGSDGARAAVQDLVLAGLPGDVEAHVLAVADPLVRVPADDAGGAAHRDRPSASLVSTARALAADATREATAECSEGLERVTTLFPGWRARADLVTDAPHRGLLRAAKEWGADLVVVGSTGRGGLDRVLLGSVSQRVLADAHCSVRIARARERANAQPPRLIVAVDGSPHSDAAVTEVARRRWPEGTDVRVLTAIHPQFAMAVAHASGAIVEHGYDGDVLAAGRRCARRAARRLVDAGLRAIVAVEECEPTQFLLNFARKWSADSIVIGAKGHGRVARALLGSVSAAVASRAPCSVEVVRPVGTDAI